MTNPLFRHLTEEYGLTLTQPQLEEIINNAVAEHPFWIATKEMRDAQKKYFKSGRSVADLKIAVAKELQVDNQLARVSTPKPDTIQKELF